MLDLWWTKWHWDRFMSELFSSPLSVLFHRSQFLYIIFGTNIMAVGTNVVVEWLAFVFFSVRPGFIFGFEDQLS